MHKPNTKAPSTNSDRLVAQLQLATYGLHYARTRKEVEALVSILSKARRVAADVAQAKLTS